MPFRQKMKKVFGRSSSQSSSGDSNSSRKDSSVYQPGEPMPVPKYRGFVDPKHKARLETFSFGPSEWRRQSTNSGYSPMGSKFPSRNNSTAKGQHNNFAESQATHDESVGESKGASEHREYAGDAHPQAGQSDNGASDTLAKSEVGA